MKLDQYLKWKGWVSTGGEAKQRIQNGEVSVNGTPWTPAGGGGPGQPGRRGRCRRGGHNDRAVSWPAVLQRIWACADG